MPTWMRRTENRAADGGGAYENALIQAILSRAEGATLAIPDASGAVEAAAGLVSRAFVAAEIEGAPPHVIDALSPELLGMIGRALIRRGEFAAAIDVDRAGRVRLAPAQTIDVRGAWDPAAWTYRLTIPGPDTYTTRSAVPSASVVHVRAAVDPDRPWRGIGPVQSATLAGRLLAALTAALGDEAAGPRGSLLPVPKTDGDDATVTALKGDLKRLGGDMALVESMADEWQAGASGGSRSAGWEPRRVGANPPAALVSLLETAGRDVLAACGISPALFSGGDGTAAREAWRQALWGLIAPLGRLAERELREKLGAPNLSIGWAELRASDLQGRARAFQSMVGGGMSVASAASIAGLEGAEVAPSFAKLVATPEVTK